VRLKPFDRLLLGRFEKKVARSSRHLHRVAVAFRVIIHRRCLWFRCGHYHDLISSQLQLLRNLVRFRLYRCRLKKRRRCNASSHLFSTLSCVVRLASELLSFASRFDFVRARVCLCLGVSTTFMDGPYVNHIYIYTNQYRNAQSNLNIKVTLLNSNFFISPEHSFKSNRMF
jgi:hypothetical protein